MNTRDVLDLNDKIKEHYTKGKFKDRLFLSELLLPRIVNKLTLCICHLSGQFKFNRSISDMINNFLSCFPSPVCLIAHNGNAYDLPLFEKRASPAGKEEKRINGTIQLNISEIVKGFSGLVSLKKKLKKKTIKKTIRN